MKKQAPLLALFILVSFPWSHLMEIQLPSTQLKIVLLLKEHHTIDSLCGFLYMSSKGLLEIYSITSKDECCPFHRTEADSDSVPLRYHVQRIQFSNKKSFPLVNHLKIFPSALSLLLC